ALQLTRMPLSPQAFTSLAELAPANEGGAPQPPQASKGGWLALPTTRRSMFQPECVTVAPALCLNWILRFEGPSEYGERLTVWEVQSESLSKVELQTSKMAPFRRTMIEAIPPSPTESFRRKRRTPPLKPVALIDGEVTRKIVPAS